MKTTKKQIKEWCKENTNILPLNDRGYEEADYDRCFRCLCDLPTQRCHVIPAALGGKDTPSNYRLLCETCHLDAPNVNEYEAMDKWIWATQQAHRETIDAQGNYVPLRNFYWLWYYIYNLVIYFDKYLFQINF